MKIGEEIGSIRVLVDGLSTVKKTKSGWRAVRVDIPGTFAVIKLFEKNNFLEALVDAKNPKFLKGGLTFEGEPFGARVNVLPSKHKLDKAFSLFARGLMIHDELSNSHWDVIFMNPNGKYSYLYSVEKKERAKKRKYSVVESFEKNLEKINRGVDRGVVVGDVMALAMRTLLETKMRVGGEIYYRAHGHKGLTTLKKGDVKISGERVNFSFISKDGVPQKISASFSKNYLKSLKSIFKRLKKSDFIFTDEFGRPLKDKDFMKAFKSYCGEEFYPHIVRSHYATKRVEDFMKGRKSATAEEVENLFTEIAEKLGHKKYSKDDGEWKIDYGATVHYYINPEDIEKVLKLKSRIV